MYHDLLYNYGFDEAAANFQSNNFGKGGRGGDSITANVQASGTNNANFATPPDGQAGTMNMYVFTYSTPNRDSDLDNGVLVHELTHGLSNRLTGGTGNGNCLQTNEARGMGEGWSDTVAWWNSMKSDMTKDTDRATGAYVLNNPNGIRTFKYSTSLTTNQHKYSSLKTITAVHQIGNVWSTFLYEVYWEMLAASEVKFSEDRFDAASPAGNVRFLKNFVDGLKLQPCNPTLITARDAIILADKRNNGGKYVCAIWRGFAKRGLGAGATPGKDDSFALGDGC
ncbi:peptidase M36 [Chytridium lagenaria]|nr:peptidase M36 [Chytridium lagenaria]